MVRRFFWMIYTAVGSLVFGELLARFATTHLTRRRFVEFPTFSPLELSKFVNYHPYLGWEPRPTTDPITDTNHAKAQSKPKSGGAKCTYKINDDGSRYQPPPNRPLERGPVEIFGDSSAFCRDNNDNETYAFYLERDHGLGPTRNFGVGNYGIDQAYLRATEKMTGNGIAVMDIALQSIYRCLVVYKQYSELGNSWAVKPRFRFDPMSREWQLVERPFRERDELCNLRAYASVLRLNDYFYPTFKSNFHEQNFSHLIYLMIHKHALAEVARKVPQQHMRRIAQGIALKLGKRPYRPHENPDILLGIAEGEGGELVARIIMEFRALAKERGSIPFVFISPQGFLLRYPLHCHKISRQLERHCIRQGVSVPYDFGNVLMAKTEMQKAKLKAYHVHMSPEGNRVKADWLAAQFAGLH